MLAYKRGEIELPLLEDFLAEMKQDKESVHEN
jgi:hypothetical protein